MGNYKFKLKEQRTTLKPKDVDQALIKRLEAQYGPVDMVNDFFSGDLKTYFKTDSVNPETGAISHRIIKLASFGESLQRLHLALEALKSLAATPEGKTDKKVIETLVKVREAFNGFRTYLRKYYPDQYEAVKSQLDEMSTIGTGASFTSGTEGENYATPKAFSKYKYKIKNQKPLNEAEFNVDTFVKDLNIPNPKLSEWVRKRIEAFSTLERQLNLLVPMLQQAKKETIKQYSQNPNFKVIYGTDLAEEYLDDIIELFKNTQ